MVEKKLKLLEESLTEKRELLEQLLELSDRQAGALEDSTMSEEAFDAYMDEQEYLIEQLEGLNAQTDEVCRELERENTSDIVKYEEMTKRIQALIVQLAERLASLKEAEETNKYKLEKCLEVKRKSFGEGRRTSKVALDYYKSMSKSNVIPPQFMDKKK